MLAVGVAAVAAIALTGCTPSPGIPHDAKDGGQTLAELETALASIPGLTVEKVGGSAPNIKDNTGFEYELRLDPAYRVADGGALVTYLVEAAWSVREGYMPNTSIEISFWGVPGDDFNIAQAAKDEQWLPEDASVRPVNDEGWSSASVWLAEKTNSDTANGGPANRQRLGDWPGDVPSVPDGVIVTRSSATPGGDGDE